ncbi:uncharacterized protein [Typha latifolia]|uniref:uncharacterized protein n=1 Tax=Typha latifolia TaxID=4733 RepID=UPI003C2F70A8
MANGGAPATNCNPKSRPKNPSSLNPNWAQLQEKLRSRRLPKPLDPDSRTPALPSLGKRKERPEAEPSPPLSSGLSPTSDDTSLTQALAMDCEMVGVGPLGNKSALGRVTLVNSWGNVVYDEYVRAVEHIVDFRTNISGIRPKHMKKAKEFWAVQKKVGELIKGRILVGHALHNDLKVLLLSHPKKDIRDTSLYEPFKREGRKRALKDLAAQILGVKIQQNEHCPIQDAQAAMFIYNKHKREWEKSIKSLFRSKRKLSNRRKNKPTEEVKADV